MSEVIIQSEDFSVAAEYSKLCDLAPRSGAVVFFIGLVRDLYDEANADQIVEYIELTHYAGMTEALCQKVIDEARLKFPFDAARVVHRVGKLNAGDQIVMVAIASRHRDAAVDAARYIMDYLKTRATLWKKEVGSRGDRWIGLKASDVAAAKKWSVE